jgi:hypothetical protein
MLGIGHAVMVNMTPFSKIGQIFATLQTDDLLIC